MRWFRVCATNESATAPRPGAPASALAREAAEGPPPWVSPQVRPPAAFGVGAFSGDVASSSRGAAPQALLVRLGFAARGFPPPYAFRLCFKNGRRYMTLDHGPTGSVFHSSRSTLVSV